MLNVKFRVTVSQGHVKNMERFQQEIAIMKARAQRHGMAWDGTMHRSANRFKRSASTCSCMLMAADRIAIPSALALSGARSWTIRTSSNSTRLLKIAGSKDRLQRLHGLHVFPPKFSNLLMAIMAIMALVFRFCSAFRQRNWWSFAIFWMLSYLYWIYRGCSCLKLVAKHINHVALSLFVKLGHLSPLFSK